MDLFIVQVAKINYPKI